MGVWALILGILVLVVVMVDVIWSTLSTNGAGPVARMVSRAVWVSFAAVQRKWGSHRLMKTNVVVILVVTFLSWVFLLWSGWYLVFASAAEAVLVEATEEPAWGRDRVYFVGMTLFTLGTGDMIAGTPGWRMLMSIAAVNGLVLITMVITYLLPVISAGIERRQLALSIWGLGATAAEILENGWNGENFQDLEGPLDGIAIQLMLHAERHLAYPVLQYFHAADPRADLPPRVAMLQDALLLLEVGVKERARPSKVVLRRVSTAVDRYLQRMIFHQIKEPEEAPELPRLDRLEKRGVPLQEEKKWEERFEEREEARKLLYGSMRVVGWEWGQ